MTAIRIEPWGPDDLPILEKTMGDPAMTEHLGGPESPEKLADRQQRYEKLADSGTGRMFKIVHEETGLAIGSVGYWDKTWNDEEMYEIGWAVIPTFQGRGIAKAATALAISAARQDGKHRFIHAFPSVKNEPSNGICRSLGFSFVRECTFEFPVGHFIQCNDWRLTLTGP